MIEVEFEGLTLVCEPIEREFGIPAGERLDQGNRFFFENLKPGDTYIGKRNGPWKMGTVSKSLWEKTCENGWIYAEELVYPYNVGECLKVLSIKE